MADYPLTAKDVRVWLWQTRVEGCSDTTTVKLSLWQKLGVTNEIHALCRLHLLSWSSNYVTCLSDVSILLM